MPTQPARATSPRLLKSLIRTVREQRLFDRGQHLLVAVSGGPDSTALLALLVRLAPSWRLRLTAVHVNYRLRGNESDEDEAFVTTFCKARRIPLVVLRPALLRQRRRSSLQEIARTTRYEAMKKLAHEIGAHRIVLGHTANDQAETMLMWMLRGAGLAGLAGMPFIREAIIVRPLLSSAKEDILTFLNQEGLSYREDSSNATGLYRRNRIRMELLPALTKIAPAAIKVLQRQADLLREDERYLDHIAREQWALVVTCDPDGTQRLAHKTFSALPTALQRRLVRLLLRAYEPEGRAAGIRVVESARRFILTGKGGTLLRLHDAVLRREGDTVFFARRGEGRPAAVAESASDLIVPVVVPSTVYWGESGVGFQVQALDRQEVEPLLHRRSKHQAIFDADRFSPPLVLRSWRRGDRFQPCGMKGKSKKLQDLFTDLKIPRYKRAMFPLLAATEGILWVAGLRQDERFVIRGGTRRCLVVTMIDTIREGAS